MHAISPSVALPLAPGAWGPCKPLDPTDYAAPVPLQGSPSSNSTQDNCLSTLPRQTLVRIVGNQRTKRSLLGLECVVKRATGLGGWHWLVRGGGMRAWGARQHRSRKPCSAAPAVSEALRHAFSHADPAQRRGDQAAAQRPVRD